MNGNKVIIFTYYWPPAGGPGVQRFLKFCKYLTSFQWEPIVITPAKGSYPYIDEHLLKDVPQNLRVIKTKSRDPFKIYNFLQGKRGKASSVGLIGLQEDQNVFQKLSKYIRANFFIPDARVGWNKYAIKAANKVINQEQIDAIITTGPPHSTHLIGLTLQQKHNIGWIADFRDPWTNMYYNAFLPYTAKTQKKQQALENKVLQHANTITVVSPGLKKEFEDRAEDIQVIYNGYDQEDFTEAPSTFSQRFSLAYIGNLKPSQNIPALWKALQELIKEQPNFKKQFELRITGKTDPGIIQSLKNYQLWDYTVLTPFVPHNKAIDEMQQSSLLLFIIPFATNKKDILTGKIFEYMASKRPILSIGPTDGDAAQLLQNTGIPDPMQDYKNQIEIKRLIKHHFHIFDQTGYTPSYKNTNPEQFNRKGMTRLLAQNLDKLHA